jgi:hypothetical protein
MRIRSGEPMTVTTNLSGLATVAVCAALTALMGYYVLLGI